MREILLVVHSSEYYYNPETALVVREIGKLDGASPLLDKFSEYGIFPSEDEEDPDADMQALADASGFLVFYFEVDPDEGWTMEYGFYWPNVVEELDDLVWTGSFPEDLYVDEAEEEAGAEEDELIEPEEPQFGTEPAVQESFTNYSVLFMALAVLIAMGLFFALVVLYQNGFRLPADFSLETIIEYLGF